MRWWGGYDGENESGVVCEGCVVLNNNNNNNLL